MQVNRLRYIEFQPKAITALAFTHESVKTCLLAAARENGNIEIWNTRPQYNQSRIIPGVHDSTVEALVWVQDRLFSAGLDGLVREWNLDTLKAKYAVECNGGSVWCMAAWENLIAIGCEDGCVRLYTVLQDSNEFESSSAVLNQRLEYVRTFDKTDARILSLAWHPDGSHLVAGTSDGSIRKMRVDTGRVVDRMLVDSKKGEESLVWSVALLPDSSIVSGDSLGNVSFWDWNTCTLKQTCKSHAADDGSYVYSSGVDRVIIQHQQVGSTAPLRWIATSKRRFHSHDVRALALNSDESVDALVSGGVDTNLIVSSPASNFTRVKQQRLPCWPDRRIVSLVKDKRWILEQKDRGVSVWSVGCAQIKGIADYQDKDRLPLLERGKLLFEIKAKLDTCVVSSSVSPDGRWVAISDAHSVKLFEITQSATGEIQISKSKAFSSLNIKGAHSLAFTFSTLIVASLNSSIYLIDMDTFTISANLDIHRKALISFVCVSNNGKWAASCDTNHCVFLIDLDAKKVHGVLPKLSTTVSCMAFSPDSTTLATAHTSNELYLFDVESKAFTQWSLENSEQIPNWLKFRREVISGLSFSNDHTIFLSGVTFSCLVDLTRSVGAPSIDLKRKRTKEQKKLDKKGNFVRIERFSPLMMLDFIGPDEMVVVERPLLKIMEALPEGFYRPRFGE